MKSFLLSSLLALLLLLVVGVHAAPRTQLPPSQVSGSVSSDSGSEVIQDGIAIWWAKYGVSQNVLELHFFTKKLDPHQRRFFVEKYSVEAETARAFGGKSIHPVFDIPRVVVQVSFPEKPENFSQTKGARISSTWYSKPGSMAAGGRSKKITLKGGLWDGGELAVEGTGGLKEEGFPSYSWTLSGTIPLVFMEY